MSFDGPGPEVINGRLAMIAFTTAMATEFASGLNVIEQFKLAPIPIIGVFLTIWAASLVPLYRGNSITKNGSFNFTNELINGRAAMIGFAIMVVVESLKHTTIFTQW